MPLTSLLICIFPLCFFFCLFQSSKTAVGICSANSSKIKTHWCPKQHSELCPHNDPPSAIVKTSLSSGHFAPWGMSAESNYSNQDAFNLAWSKWSAVGKKKSLLALMRFQIVGEVCVCVCVCKKHIRVVENKKRSSRTGGCFTSRKSATHTDGTWAKASILTLTWSGGLRMEVKACWGP